MMYMSIAANQRVKREDEAAEVVRLREALKVAAQALAEASTELDAAGCQRASLYAAEQNKAAWDAAGGDC